MELLYIWIGEYNNIKEQGFNFSSKYHFEFIYQKDNDGNSVGSLKRKENNNSHIENFFNQNITNVVAVIGENGVGKTSLMEYIIRSWIFLNALHDYPAIFIFQNKEKGDEGIYVYYHESIKLNILFNYKHSQKLGKSNNGVFITPIPKSFFILYSNLLQDNFKFLKDISSMINISTEGLYSSQTLDAIFYEEVEKQVIFISSEFSKEANIPFKLPEYLNISFPITDSELFSKMNGYLELSEDSKNMDIIPYISGFIDNKNWYDISKGYAHLLKKRIITIILVFRITGQINPEKDIRDDIGEIDEKYLENIILETSLLDKIDDTGSLKSLISMINEYEEFAKAQMTTIGGAEMFGTAYLSIPIEELDAIQKIIKALRNLSPDLSIHEVKWRRLSFGENILLNIYSRFYYASQELNRYHRNVENITVFVDEGELGFHPQWQKKYLNILIDFLPQVFKGKNIQLILTSHSPFLVSDLPKENIIFLTKNNKGECIVSELQDRKETFGANIHTLFTDSFFMKGGLMGTFAEKRINEVIAYLNGESLENSLFNGKTLEEQQNLAEKYISMIGEPIIKNMLQKQLDSKRLQKVEKHQQIIENQEQKIKALEDRIKLLENKS